MGGRVSRGNMAAASRVVQAVRPHLPSIKFPNRQGLPRPNVQEALKLLAVNLPQSSPPASAAAAQTATPAPRPAAALSRLPGTPDSIAAVKELPQRYRRRPLALEEMDYIQRGGPE
ncbi:28S ribosomal protein S36, mitochondrial [Astyanax mexicanus]|uniref:28S ribosomal protein S36, mitochondrial n=2 Tax=Astyanax mexicanus TaxID=7994 RepID=A0A8B9L1D0_ASTMX|nr:28S ribosomal protein S36, mitochondrial [Astyanax mexicanus]KAG9269985.1 28S ribosomal protein S36, mitochondrial [Astyanax mexicanus]